MTEVPPIFLKLVIDMVNYQKNKDSMTETDREEFERTWTLMSEATIAVGPEYLQKVEQRLFTLLDEKNSPPIKA